MACLRTFQLWIRSWQHQIPSLVPSASAQSRNRARLVLTVDEPEKKDTFTNTHWLNFPILILCACSDSKRLAVQCLLVLRCFAIQLAVGVCRWQSDSDPLAFCLLVLRGLPAEIYVIFANWEMPYGDIAVDRQQWWCRVLLLALGLPCHCFSNTIYTVLLK